MKKKQISIIGSTGSIGTQTLEVVEKIRDKFEILALTGGDNVELLRKQIKQFQPKTVCTKSDDTKITLAKEFSGIKFLCGDEGLEEICSNAQNDLVVVAVSGKIGLKPTLTAIKNKIDIALANKETLVMAGDIVMKEAGKNGVRILPIDSEHCAIHQCIKNLADVRKLIITASGGPFRNKSIEEIKNATVEQTLAHPKWHMGKKITVDSATLMNKGLEVIEAHHLFGRSYDDIEVIIHPQSLIHSAIEYVDGSVIAQIGLPSMHIPIQYALTYPERVEGIKSKSFSFLDSKRFDFEAPDLEKFPCLRLAYEAGRAGGSAAVCLNAANEEAVFAFLRGEIKLFKISEIVEKMMSKHTIVKTPSIEEIFAIDDEIRIKTREYLR
ncbi:MAG: 1-deoxy-D-xylulose-5-phosphate reductoisomerase [Candidatus Gastranaerophilaceae bacterium]